MGPPRAPRTRHGQHNRSYQPGAASPLQPVNLAVSACALAAPSDKERDPRGCMMTTLAPDRAGPAARPTAGQQDRGRAVEPARGPGRSPGQRKDDSGTRAWLRRRAVAAWMNVLI